MKTALPALALLVFCLMPQAQAGVFSGQVRDSATQLPLAGAEVKLISGAGSYATGTADGDGRFSISVNSTTNQRLMAVASMPGYPPRTHANTPCGVSLSSCYNSAQALLVGVANASADVVIAREARISGQVLDDATGMPVPRGSVTLEWLGAPATGALNADAVPGANGEFSIAGLHAGQYRLRASGYPTASGNGRYLNFIWPDQHCDDLQLRCSDAAYSALTTVAAGDTSGLTLRLRTGSYLQVRMRSAASAAPVNHSAYLWSTAASNPGLLQASGHNGAYARLGPLLAGPARLALYPLDSADYPSIAYPDTICPQYPCDLATAGIIQIPVNGTLTLDDVEVASLRRVRGRVTDAVSGEPLAGITVAGGQPEQAVLNGWGFYPRGTSVTNSNGEYSIETFAYETAIVRTLAAGAGWIDQAWQDTPCNGANLFCHDSEGSYAWFDFDPDAYVDNINFALQRGTAVRGSVRHRFTQLPATEWRVALVPLSANRLTRSVAVDADGNFELNGLTPEPYYVFASPSSFFMDIFGQFHPDSYCMIGFITDSPNCDLSQATVVTPAIGASVDGVDFIINPAGYLFSDGFDAKP
jgi:Carboxypeptidase regulatory-like domain